MLFLSRNFTAHTQSGAIVEPYREAADDAGALTSFQMRSGDVLIFDADNSGTKSNGDTVLARVARGAALVFVSDVNHDRQFQPGDFTGLAVSPGFSGSLPIGLNGPVAVMLDSSNRWAGTAIQRGSIIGLAAGGKIAGGIIADGSIQNIRIDMPADQTGLAVPYISAGFAESEYLTLNGSFTGGFVTEPSLFHPGRIHNVKLQGGVGKVSGKSISLLSVSVSSVSDIEIRTTGGSSENRDSRGGDITNIQILSPGGIGGGRIAILAGEGGIAGGISHIKIELGSGKYDSIEVLAGVGVDVACGRGGNISDVNISRFVESEFAFPTTSIYAGDGGSDYTEPLNKNGGHGGSLKRVTLFNASPGNAGEPSPTVIIAAGNGGSADKIGGRAGDTSHVKIESAGVFSGIGVGAGGPGSVTYPAFGRFGGGDISSISISGLAGDTLKSDNVFIGAGNAIERGGGHGGDVSHIRLFCEKASISAGSGPDLSRRVGHGGSVSDVKGIVGSLIIEAGSGSSREFQGGNGGAIKDIFISSGNALLLHSGEGGSGLMGGNGGVISNVHIGGDIGTNNTNGIQVGRAGMGVDINGEDRAHTDGTAGGVRHIVATTISRISTIHYSFPLDEYTIADAVSYVRDVKATTIALIIARQGSVQQSTTPIELLEF